MIATWTLLPDGSWGVRTRGQARAGSIVTVRFKDAREPRTEVVREVLSTQVEGNETLCVCSIERKAS